MAELQKGAFDHTALGMIVTGFKRDEMVMSPADAAILRGLAEQVAAIAASQRQAELRRRWTRHNQLAAGRPLVFCDPENGWNEIITLDQVKCQGTLARRWEVNLRKEIFWGQAMGDDKPVDPVFAVPYTAASDDWGLETHFEKTNREGSYTWDAPLKDFANVGLVNLRDPQIDWETTRASLEIAHTLFDGILEVRQRGTWWWTLGLTMTAAFMRGLESLMFDVFDHPDELKALLKQISDGFLRKLDYLEANRLLSLNNDGTYVGSGGYGYTTELPQKDFAGIVRPQDLWGFAESQETSSISPEMYEEFIFPFEKPILDRFGLNCYGCCEPINPRWHVVKRHKNLRRVSCSPWSDYTKMAEYLQGNYVFSMKVNPAEIAKTEGLDPVAIKAKLIRDLEITKGCVVEIIMKDNHTLGGRADNATRWCRIAQEAIDEVYGG